MGAVEPQRIEPHDETAVESDGPKSGARVRVDGSNDASARSGKRAKQRKKAPKKQAAHAVIDYGGINVGARIRDIRLGRGLSLEMMHKRGAPTATMLSSIERGLANSTVGTLANIARALNVPLFQLFTGDDECSLILRGMHDADFDRLRFVLTGK